MKERGKGEEEGVRERKGGGHRGIKGCSVSHRNIQLVGGRAAAMLVEQVWTGLKIGA